MRGMLRPERVKGKNMKKYSKIARIAAFALAVVMLFAFAGCSGKKNNNNKNNGSGNNGGSNSSNGSDDGVVDADYEVVDN